eukprot:9486241-Pyramimonas_sp.AAC.1
MEAPACANCTLVVEVRAIVNIVATTSLLRSDLLVQSLRNVSLRSFGEFSSHTGARCILLCSHLRPTCAHVPHGPEGVIIALGFGVKCGLQNGSPQNCCNKAYINRSSSI